MSSWRCSRNALHDQRWRLAFERELIDRNPARGKRRRLKERKPERTWLDRAEQIVALLDAGGELDQEARERIGRQRRDGRCWQR